MTWLPNKPKVIRVRYSHLRSPASFSVHLASSSVTPSGYVHKSRDDNCGAYVGAVEEMVGVTEGNSGDGCDFGVDCVSMI